MRNNRCVYVTKTEYILYNLHKLYKQYKLDSSNNIIKYTKRRAQ